MVGGSRLIRLLLLLLSPPLMAAAAAAGAAAVTAAAQQSSSSVVDVVRLHSVFQGAHPEIALRIPPNHMGILAKEPEWLNLLQACPADVTGPLARPPALAEVND